MRSFTCIALLFTVFALVAVSPAQQPPTSAVPNFINYSGTLVLSGEVGVPAKTVGVTFAIYGQQDGGAPIWLETRNVTPDQAGHYTVLLGVTRAEGIPADLFNTQEQRWLGVQVQGEAEQPRVLLVSVPYAMKAADAETIGGLPASAFVLAAPPHATLPSQPQAERCQALPLLQSAEELECRASRTGDSGRLSQMEKRLFARADSHWRKGGAAQWRHSA